MTKEELKAIEVNNINCISGHGSYVECLICHQAGETYETLKHSQYCRVGIIAALLVALKERDAEVKRLKGYEDVALAAEVDKVINNTRANLRGEVVDD